jgi:hypothetical protein
MRCVGLIWYRDVVVVYDAGAAAAAAHGLSGNVANAASGRGCYLCLYPKTHLDASSLLLPPVPLLPPDVGLPIAVDLDPHDGTLATLTQDGSLFLHRLVLFPPPTANQPAVNGAESGPQAEEEAAAEEEEDVLSPRASDLRTDGSFSAVPFRRAVQPILRTMLPLRPGVTVSAMRLVPRTCCASTTASQNQRRDAATASSSSTAASSAATVRQACLVLTRDGALHLLSGSCGVAGGEGWEWRHLADDVMQFWLSPVAAASCAAGSRDVHSWDCPALPFETSMARGGQQLPYLLCDMIITIRTPALTENCLCFAMPILMSRGRYLWCRTSRGLEVLCCSPTALAEPQPPQPSSPFILERWLGSAESDDTESWYLGLADRFGVLLGAESGDARAGGIGPGPGALSVVEMPVLHLLLLHLLRQGHNQGRSAVHVSGTVGAAAPTAPLGAALATAREIVLACVGGEMPESPRWAWPHTEASLERVLHAALEDSEPGGPTLLSRAIWLLRPLPCFAALVGRVARQSDVSLWPTLFSPSMAGSPRSLFQHCMADRTDAGTKGGEQSPGAVSGGPPARQLRTAALYLVILQATESEWAAYPCALQLLRAALASRNPSPQLSLAAELLSFLRRAESWNCQREEEEDTDASTSFDSSVLSTVVTPAGPPSDSSAAVGERWMSVARGVVRAGAHMDSEKLGDTETGDEVIVLETARIPTFPERQQQHNREGTADDDGHTPVHMTERVRFALGWTSVVTRTGKVLLRRAPPASSDEPEPAAADGGGGGWLAFLGWGGEEPEPEPEGIARAELDHPPSLPAMEVGDRMLSRAAKLRRQEIQALVESEAERLLVSVQLLTLAEFPSVRSCVWILVELLWRCRCVSVSTHEL